MREYLLKILGGIDKNEIRLKREEREARNIQYRRYPHFESLFFEVPGAGTICISESHLSQTGIGTVGFSIGCSWSEYGMGIGGVLGITEAKRLADHINNTLKNVKETEAELSKRLRKEREEQYFMLLQQEEKLKNNF